MSAGKAELRLEAEARRRLAAQRALREAQAWEGRLEDLARRVEAARHEYGSHAMPSPPELLSAPSVDDLAGLQEHVQAQRTLWEVTHRTLEQALARARSRIVSDALGSLPVAGRALLAEDVLGASQPAPEGRSSAAGNQLRDRNKTENRSELLQRLVSRLSPEVPEKARARVLRLAAAAQGAPTRGRAEALALELRAQVDVENRMAAGLAADRREAASLQAALLGEGSALGAAIAARLAHVVDDQEPLTDELRHRAEAVLEQAEGRAAQAFAAAAFCSAVEELGYQMDEDFETLAVERGRVYVRAPGWGDRAVRLRFYAETGELDFAMVAVSEAGPARRDPDEDARIEAEWCDGIPDLRQRLLERGVELHLQRQDEAGARRLSVVRPEFARLPPLSMEELRRAERKRQEGRAKEKGKETGRAENRRHAPGNEGTA